MGHFTVAVGAGLLCIELILVKYPGFSILLFYFYYKVSLNNDAVRPNRTEERKASHFRSRNCSDRVME